MEWRKLVIAGLLLFWVSPIFSQEVPDSQTGVSFDAAYESPGPPTSPAPAARINARDSMKFFDSLKKHQRPEYNQQSQPMRQPFIQNPGGLGQNNLQMREELLRTQNQLNIINEEISIVRSHLENLTRIIQATGVAAKNRAMMASRLAQVGVPSPGPLNIPMIQNPPTGGPSRLPIAGPGIPAPITTPTDSINIGAVKDQIAQLQNRLHALQEQQHQLVQRLTDLRNRLI